MRWHRRRRRLTGLKGKLPGAAALKGLTSLLRLGIGDQPDITGPVPADWAGLKQLQEIRAGNNSLSGTLPAGFSALRQLRVLYLWSNKLTGTLPAAWKALANMEDLQLAKNKLS